MNSLPEAMFIRVTALQLPKGPSHMACFDMFMNAKARNAHVASEAIRILIVEDEMLTALAASATLSELGYTVVDAVPTAAAALRAAATRRPDLVLMDITLQGGTDGIAAAGLLKEQFGLPILFVTAHSESPTRDRAAAIGPVGYLLKPYSPQQLGMAVAGACATIRSRDSTPSKAFRLHHAIIGVS